MKFQSLTKRRRVKGKESKKLYRLKSICNSKNRIIDMKKHYVLPWDHLPTRSPFLLSIVLYIFLDLYVASGWIWGVSWTLMLILWVSYFFALFAQKSKPIDGYGSRDE